MAIIKVDTDNVVEPYTLPADTEAGIRIIMVREGNDKNGNPYLMPVFEINDEIAAKEFSYFISLPSDAMSEKQNNAATYKYITFCNAFGIDPGAENDPEDFVGLEGAAILGSQTSEGYGEQNTIKSFI